MGEVIVGKFMTDLAQNAEEWASYCKLVAKETVTRYLEIGSRYGGSLWAISEFLPAGATIVSVDYPNDQGGRSDSRDSLIACIDALRRDGFNAHVIFGDSTAPEVIAEVKALSHTYDACLIDANHSLAYVTSDWRNYGNIARMVAFHDINWKRKSEWQGKRIEVPALWNQIKRRHRYIEFIREAKNNGIGVLWH